MDLYTLFRLPSSCSQDEIIQQYRKLSQDIYGKLRLAQGDGSELDIFYSQQKQLKEALEILIHPKRRRSYDLFLQFNQDNVSLPDSVEDFWNIILPTQASPSLFHSIELSRIITKLQISSEYLGSHEEYDEQVTATHIPKTTVYNELEVDKRSTEDPARPQVRSTTAILEEKDSEATQVSKRSDRLDDNPTELFEKSPRLQKKSAKPKSKSNIHSKAKAAIQRDRSQSNIEKIFAAYGHDGRFLREVRKLRGYDIEKLSHETMVAEEYIQHIEANAFDQLPAELYTMNYIKRIAGVLRISNRNIVDDYMRIYHNQVR
jgi:hypothetical protein